MQTSKEAIKISRPKSKQVMSRTQVKEITTTHLMASRTRSKYNLMIVLGCLSGVAEGSFHLGQDTTSRGGPDLEALRQKGILLEFLRPSR